MISWMHLYPRLKYKNAIRHLKCDKACGVDGIPSEWLRYAADSLDLPLTALFNYVFDTGE